MLLLTVLTVLTACTRPGDHPISSNCAWIEKDDRPLDLQNAADRRHLRNDAITAEDVAVRWADKYVGITPQYPGRRDQCMQSLFNDISHSHGVDIAVVRQFRLERDVFVDSAVTLSFGVVYILLAYYFAGWINRRFQPGETGFWILILSMSVGAALVGVAAGSLWSIILEGVRLNSGHLSYRMNRIPFRRHWFALYVASFLIFGLTAAIRSFLNNRIRNARLPSTKIVSLLLLGFFAATPLHGQDRTPFTTTMARSIRRMEPGWRYTYGWCTCPPTVPGQVWRDIGTWERKDKEGRGESVEVWIVKAASPKESEDWMQRVGRGGSQESCVVEAYKLGDEAYLLHCPKTYKNILNLRKGRFIVHVRSDSQELVERFARYVVMRLPTS